MVHAANRATRKLLKPKKINQRRQVYQPEKEDLMTVINSLSLCGRMTLDLHSLNNEGTEGNQQQTRMVHIIDQRGRRAVVNAVSGDMFKHILVEHLIPLLKEAKQPLSPGAATHDADRINAQNPE